MYTSETFFKFCNKLVFELLAIALHYLSAAGVRLTRDRYYCTEVKIAGQCSFISASWKS